MDLIRREIASAIRATSDERTVDIIASTGEIDSYGERVDPAGIDLARYAKNPVLLFGHNAYGLPIGHTEDVRVEGNELRALGRFVSAAANPDAERAYQCARQKALRGVSIGFRSKATRVDTIEGRSVVVHTAVELVEISLVTLPANPGAVVTDARSALTQGRDSQPMKQWQHMTMDERRAALETNREKAIAQRDAKPTFRGKSWDELSVDEMIACRHEDNATFLAMQKDPPASRGYTWGSIAEEED